MMKINVTMILDDRLAHEMGEFTVDQLVTPSDVQHIADEVLGEFERFYSPERMMISLGDEQEVFGQVTFDESGTFTLECA